MENKLELVVLPIPREELTEYKDYIGFLFKNENSVYNVCFNEEDIMKSNQWFKNMPQKAIVVSNETINIGDKFLGKATNDKLNNNIFTFVGWTEGGVDLIDIEDEKGEKSISTIYLLDSPKFIRMATPTDLKKVVEKQSVNIF
jgi:hypothetical protein